ncbi:ABC-2 family transporter protein [Pigmentibacter sp. JX0631]|uniref:ABC-2 family transporter protein n=1 Tax=Pigmentibacter sp. JX0631 TaxID=2976982 RepID=UPI002468F1E7|nr:ABC-2 family transporter protein [Pigmentibacter sp. JX0631]WGL61020.1 ABC-2 family transporter protein [Pigmentibacter sp. JX0631]
MNLMTMIKYSEKIKKFIKIYTTEFLANKATVISLTIGGFILPILVQLITWNFVFANNEQIKQYTFSQIVIYVSITVLLMVTNDSDEIISTMSERIKNGSIDIYKTKPISNFSLILHTSLGRNCIFIALTSLILFIFTIVFNPIITIPVFILYLLSQILLIQIAYTFSLFCYWFINSFFINYLFYLVLQIVGGFLIPIDLWPEPYQTVLRYNPFRIIISAIPDVILNPTPKNLISTFLLAIFYIIVFIYIIKFIEKITIKKYTSHGG